MEPKRFHSRNYPFTNAAIRKNERFKGGLYLPRFCRGSRPAVAAAVKLPELKSCPPKAVGPPKSPVSELRLNAGSPLPKRCAAAKARERTMAKQTAN